MPVESVVMVALIGVSALTALIAGGQPERFGGLILIIWLGFAGLHHWLGGPYDVFVHVDPVTATVDGAAFAALLALAIYANRVWPMIAASVQSVVILGHVSMLVVPGMQRAYWVMTQVPPLLVAAVLVFGTIAHQMRVRRIGPYRDWR